MSSNAPSASSAVGSRRSIRWNRAFRRTTTTHPFLPRIYRGALDRYRYFKDMLERVRGVEGDVSGLLVEPGDIDALAADPVLRACLGAARQSLLERRFSRQPAQSLEALLLKCSGVG